MSLWLIPSKLGWNLLIISLEKFLAINETIWSRSWSAISFCGCEETRFIRTFCTDCKIENNMIIVHFKAFSFFFIAAFPWSSWGISKLMLVFKIFDMFSQLIPDASTIVLQVKKSKKVGKFFLTRLLIIFWLAGQS